MGRKNKLGNLEVYNDSDEQEERKGFLKKIWDKTIFPDKIKAKKEKEAYEAELRAQARKEAEPEIRKKLVEQYKQEEIDRVVNKKSKSKDMLQKLADGFSTAAQGVAGPDKITSMMGGREVYREPYEEPPKGKPKRKTTKKKSQTKKETHDDSEGYDFQSRIERML